MLLFGCYKLAFRRHPRYLARIRPTRLVWWSVHTLAMLGAGIAIAWAVYRWLGLQFIRRAWFNLDLLWGATLIIAGSISSVAALWGMPH